MSSHMPAGFRRPHAQKGGRRPNSEAARNPHLRNSPRQNTSEQPATPRNKWPKQTTHEQGYLSRRVMKLKSRRAFFFLEGRDASGTGSPPPRGVTCNFRQRIVARETPVPFNLVQGASAGHRFQSPL